MDHILYWNQVALDANKRDFSQPQQEQGGPTLSSRALAIVHLAMYDAHAGAKGNPPELPPYLPNLPTPTETINATVAVSAAARHCLCKLYAHQREHFDRAYEEILNGLSGAEVEAGKAFGLAVAEAMLADRHHDPYAEDCGYVGKEMPRHHRPDPSNPWQGFHAPFYGEKSKCFAVTERHGLDAPPASGELAYVEALRQVRDKGIAPELMGTLPHDCKKKRTPDETLIGLYWAYDGPNKIGTPPRLYNQILRKIAIDKGNSEDSNAKLFAMVNAAMGDAGILAWEQKYKHDLWRPVLGIREHDASMGPEAPGSTSNINDDCDPEWLPLGAPASNSNKPNFTPPFPAYPSGHATFGAAAFQIIRLWYDKDGTGIISDSDKLKDNGPDKVWTGSFVSDELNGVTTDNKGVVRSRHVRKFSEGLWQMIVENGWSRIYLGVHWIFDAFALNPAGEPDLSQDKIGGVPLGLKIANDIYKSWNVGGDIKGRAAAAAPEMGDVDH